ncbi:hypothetical protein FA15DRAFT_648267 [Coprinopsis marcescibilis]|uniref:INO80 complex subunit B-like conserved region domain-containing protein n=1 Tax=Coprinopsis marcescibilis TaxID=230819 RepID=A0A5C3KHJ2_COPMA|nr:hypothetical protein FA15DRAFT_648267 [Coprinopsis marcescibilis]
MELALKREETARKRKNLSEKKLEDEKAETINRLLKKQTRPQARRMGTADSPFHGSSTPTGVEDVDVEQVPVPTMYRWVSRVVDVDVGAGRDHHANVNPNPDNDKSAPGRVERKIVMSFSVPASAFPGWEVPEEYPSAEAIECEPDPNVRMQMGPGVCAVEGCGGKRKDRCVKDWTVGACGMAHLKALETRWVGS